MPIGVVFRSRSTQKAIPACRGETTRLEGGFVGIEVKYAENLQDQPAPHRARYDEVTAAMDCFDSEMLGELRRKPIEQIWRDHMLMGSMLLHRPSRWDDALYVFIYPKDNDRCAVAVDQYARCLRDPRRFEPVTLEAVVDALENETRAPWVRQVRDRYLGWEKIERAMGGHRSEK